MIYNPGDILGFSGRGFVSDTINVLTYGIPRWSISHVAIIGDYEGRLLLFESTTLDGEPCAILRTPIHGVQSHEIEPRVAMYNGRVWHYPLVYRLVDWQSELLTNFLMSVLGVSYDELGAFRSGGFGFSFIESKLRPANLHSIFCSELVAASHSKINVFKTDNVSRWNPNLLLRRERRRQILRAPIRLK